MASDSGFQIPALVLVLFLFPAIIHGWGLEGHEIICQIAQARLSDAAAAAVKDLLPSYADDDLSSLCIWADKIKFHYPWSRQLHYINTPDVCNYNYKRDCKDDSGKAGRCVSGAITNYTEQLLTYKSSDSQYNLTEALLFLSHFVGDVHQPLHAAFASDEGGNTIDVHWYTRKTVLHHVWDSNIIERSINETYDSDIQGLVDALNQNITGDWSSDVRKWEPCSEGNVTCPDIYASEGITAACDWAYKDVTEDSVLEDDYFLTRLPVVNLRLAQGGVRLAATLNRIFG